MYLRLFHERNDILTLIKLEGHSLNKELPCKENKFLSILKQFHMCSHFCEEQ